MLKVFFLFYGITALGPRTKKDNHLALNRTIVI